MWDFSFKSYYGDSVWSAFIQIGLLLIFLVIGNILRKKVPFLRKSYIPTALIGGLLFAIVEVFFKYVFGLSIIDKDLMKVITYHALAIGFIAMTLKVSDKGKKNGLGTLSIQNGLMTGSTYMIQAVFGILTVLIFYWASKSIFYDAGVILPLSFGQGPGNALTWDMNFSSVEHMTNIGGAVDADGNVITMGTNGNFGLALASIGFIVASLVGVIYINIFRRKGEIVRGVTQVTRTIDEFIDENEIEDNDSIDKLTIQIGLVAICYAMTFGIMKALSFSKFTSSIAWGFNFIFGVISATLVKVILNFLQKKKTMKHRYINNYQMDRISGFAFDIMIIAGVAAIEFNEIKQYIFVILALTIVGTVVTYVYLRFMTKHCFKGYEHEMFLVNFGTLTGTASNGMILLREVDPQFETRSSDIFVVSQFPAMVGVAPLLLFLNFTAKSLKFTIISMFIFAVLAIIYTIIILILSKKYKQRPVKK